MFYRHLRPSDGNVISPILMRLEIDHRVPLEPERIYADFSATIPLRFNNEHGIRLNVFEPS